MANEEFDQFLAASLEELEAKQQQLAAEYRLGSWPRFVVDYAAGSLQFFENEALRVDAAIVPVGTHVSESKSFQWAWANEQLPSHVRKDAARVARLRDYTGIDLFTSERITCDNARAWEITAMACKFLGALGAYRVPHRKVDAYLLISAARCAP